ncbi:mobilization protein MbpA [Salinimicrobium sp. GXAS 041]|uniref:mobilization protein MbpA n=1 Tax=Salinimicrobium sp. GXAS 041 TaxID=3400806 RepID=UPI003C748FFD
MKTERQLIEKKAETRIEIPLPVVQQDSQLLGKLKKSDSGNDHDFCDDNSRCVPVGTILITPDGRNEKKERFKGKSQHIKFRCSIYEKKLLKIKAKHSGISLSEFCRRAAHEKEIKERLSEDHIEIYKTLSKFHNNFKSIGNMFRKKDPKLSREVYKLADEIKTHLQNVKR